MSCLPRRFPRNPDCAPVPLLAAAAAFSVYVCIGALRSCRAGSGLLLLPCFCFSRLCLSDPLLGVPDGNDTNNQPTQGPRHYDTLSTKIFYGQLLRDDLKDYAAALPVFEEVAEG